MSNLRKTVHSGESGRVSQVSVGLKVKKSRPRLALPAWAAVCLCLGMGCGPRLPPSKPLDALTPAEHAGRELYVARCGGCHYPNSSAPLHGPGLYAVLRNPYLPSGAPATDDRVAEVVVRGRGLMPAFGRTLDEQELQQLLAYLHTL